jgi:transcription elongation factor GreA
MAMDSIPMTPEGFKQLEEKVRFLTYEEMPRLEKSLGEAREKGDLSENAEYDAAREEIWNTEQMLAELTDRLARAEVISPSQLPTDSIAIGALVKTEDLDAKFTEEILLVGEGENRSGFDCVSVASPLGHAFIGKKIGDVVEVAAPRGTLRFKVLEFKYM